MAIKRHRGRFRHVARAVRVLSIVAVQVRRLRLIHIGTAVLLRRVLVESHALRFGERPIRLRLEFLTGLGRVGGDALILSGRLAVLRKRRWEPLTSGLGWHPLIGLIAIDRERLPLLIVSDASRAKICQETGRCTARSRPRGKGWAIQRQSNSLTGAS